jgi:hypothetical protein
MKIVLTLKPVFAVTDESVLILKRVPTVTDENCGDYKRCLQ